MRTTGIVICYSILLIISTQVDAQQGGLNARVTALESQVSTLSNQIANLTGSIQALQATVQTLQAELGDQTLCSSKLKFFSPSSPSADIDGCVASPQMSTLFEATILATVKSDVFSNPDEFLALNTVAGNPTHVEIATRCATLGNNGFSKARVLFLDSNDDVILSLEGCNDHGVSNGESTGMGNDKIVPIPQGSEKIVLRTRQTRTIGGKNHNEALVTVNVLGSP